MKLGEWTLSTVSGGRFKVDGGTMFAVVPKALWSHKTTPDPLNRINQATNCLLIQTGQKNILIDTGYGSKLSDKRRKLIGAEPGNPLEQSLQNAGVARDQIDLVILTHLHFDHAGGLTRKGEDEALELEFPNALVVIQQGEWEIANANLPELSGVYDPDNFKPLADSDRLRLIEGDEEIVPGIRTRVTGGHTQHHQAIEIVHEGETFLYLADICPTRWHLRTAWCIGYDLFQFDARKIKRSLLQEAAQNEGWVLFDHDPDYAAAKVSFDAQGEPVLGETIARL